MPAVDLADSIIEGAGLAIAQCSAEVASRELPWDGYGGLVRICDDDSLREHGVVRAVSRQTVALGRRDVQHHPQEQPPAARAIMGQQDLSLAASQPAAQSTAAGPSAAPSTVGLFGTPAASAAPSGGVVRPPPAAEARGEGGPGTQCGAQRPPGAHSAAKITGWGATGSTAPSGGTGGAPPGPGSAAVRPAPRRVPSWVQEYVLDGEGGGGGGGEEGPPAPSGAGPPAGGSGIDGPGPAGPAGVPVGGGTGGWWAGGKFTVQQHLSKQPPPKQPSPQPPPVVQQHLQQLQNLQRQMQQLQQQQQQRARSGQKVAGDPDLSWVSQLPTPPANKPVRK